MNGYMDRLRDLIAGQRRFIADASHQLRTPLTVLKTQAELALRSNDPAAMREIVEGIARTTDSTVHLANRLLTLARAEHGAAEGRLASVSLTEVARQVGMELAMAAVKKDIDLSRKILFDTLWRQAALVLAAALLSWFAVRFVLRPLMRLTDDVATRAPTDLSDFNAALVHRELRPLVVAMNGYMDRLRDLIAGQRRFIADASHQLRTPLTVLKTQAELALRANDPAAMREIVEGIARTTDSTVHLANRLLTLARAEHGAAEGRLASVSLTEVARQVGMELAMAAVKKDLDLSLDAEDEVEVAGNALLLHELLANLLDNAIRYTPAGGRLALRVTREADGAALLEVEDSGIGIPATERERVFAPFYRAPGAQQVNGTGAGLGLTIVRDIAVLHGACITLDDSPHGGLKVRVRFPA
jgi:two-component system sensor histidine kinase TctE